MATDAVPAQETETAADAGRRLLVVATDALTEGELLDELQRNIPGEDARVFVLAPAVEETAIRHALGDVDTATRSARERLDTSLAELRRRGISAFGEIGDSDPVVAAAETLRQYPADEVLLVANSPERARWYENGLFDRARQDLHAPVRLIAVRHEEDGGAEIAESVRSDSIAAGAGDSGLENSASPSRFSRGELVGMALAVAATILIVVVAVVLI